MAIGLNLLLSFNEIYMNNSAQEDSKKTGIKRYFELGEVFTYWFRKHDPNRPTNLNLKMMHGINKISMIMFLVGIIFVLVKKFLF
jgi:hypothetical protein